MCLCLKSVSEIHAAVISWGAYKGSVSSLTAEDKGEPHRPAASDKAAQRLSGEGGQTETDSWTLETPASEVG